MATRLSRQIFWAFLAAVATAGTLVVWRGFPPHHALICGMGAAALVYSIQRSTENLRNLYRK